MKRCGRCGNKKPVSEFHKRGRAYQAWCKTCRRSYDHAYHAATRPRRLQQNRARHEEIVRWCRSLKEGTPCTDCGGYFHHAAMAWDHLPGFVKSAEISRLVQQNSRGAILREILKCELVCANCHAVRSYERRRGVAQPG